MLSLYELYYDDIPVRINGKKYVYFERDHAENALKSVARRRVRLQIDSWKNLILLNM